MSRLRISGRGRDAGGVAVIVGILLASGVLLGMGALVVDVGQLYAERETLQSGADAAAMAYALDCAYGRTSECDNANGTVRPYANANATDKRNGVEYACRVDQSTDTCSGEAVTTGRLSDCIGTVPANANYVEVRTSTELPDGSTFLPPSFAQTFAGGYKGMKVQACARVGWGSPAGGLAITFCIAEWNAATSQGTNFAPAPPAIPDPSYEHVMVIHSGNGKPDPEPTDQCPPGPSGWDMPGDFGWTEPTNDTDCLTLIGADGWYGTGPGVPGKGGCEDVINELIDNRTPVSIPIFDDAKENGGNATYHVTGFAAFVITGYHIPSFSKSGDRASWLTDTSPCKGDDKCIYGYYTQALVDWNGSFGSTPGLGASVIKTIG
jgi:Flp pilus assembly protein TadG